ncbi:MAG: hypothetical protein Kow0074_10330 [Candidatus Zixiibacteriota bacterium]
MTDTKARILIVSPRIAGTFIRQDARLLQSEFDVTLLPFLGMRSFRDLSGHIANTDVVMIWFAGRHSVPAVWLAQRHRKPVVTIVGGYEAAWIPSIGYGVRPGSLRHRALRWVLRQSRRIVAVSTVTRDGVLNVLPDVVEKLKLIYNAVDTDRFAPRESTARDGVLCVGAIKESTIEVKGWRAFCHIATAMPDVRFTAIGPTDDFARRELISNAPENITWKGPLYDQHLIDSYQQASVYLQASVHESFSVALAEAMACGCIPVTTRGGALPEVAGPAGYLIDPADLQATVGVVREALAGDQQRRARARAQILENFALERRRQGLTSLLTKVLAEQ